MCASDWSKTFGAENDTNRIRIGHVADVNNGFYQEIQKQRFVIDVPRIFSRSK
jgi:hypothetical protein